MGGQGWSSSAGDSTDGEGHALRASQGDAAADIRRGAGRIPQSDDDRGGCGERADDGFDDDLGGLPPTRS